MRTAFLTTVVALFLACDGGAPAHSDCATKCPGCCDEAGKCQSGGIAQACGGQGMACRACGLNELCTLGICLSNAAGGGVASGTGGGSSSATGGGAEGTGGGTSSGTGGGTANTGGGTSSTGGGTSSTGGGTASTGGGTSSTGGGTASTGGGTSSIGGGAAGGGTGGGSTGQPGENCSTATALTFNTIGVATFSADNSAYLNDGQGSCGDAQDRVFRFDLATTQLVNITASGLVAFHLRTDCNTATSEEACSNTGSITKTLLAGTHYLWAEGSGAFNITVHRYPPGDVCSNAEALALTSDSAVVTGTLDAYDTNTSGCALTKDRAYTFTTTTPTSFRASVSTPGFTGALQLDQGCGARAECSDASQAIFVNRLPAGKWTLWVGASSAPNGGTFTLTVKLAPPLAGDYCEYPISLPPTGGVSSALGTTLDAGNEFDSTCGGAAGGELVYQVVQNAPGRISAMMLGTAPGAVAPVLSLVSGCGAGQKVVGCNATRDGGEAAMLSYAVDAGVYYLYADALSGQNGNYGVGVVQNYAGPQVNGGCSSAIALPLTNNVTGMTDTTARSGLAVMSAECSTAATTTSPGVLYSVNVPSAGRLNVSLVPLDGLFDPLVRVFQGSCGTPTELLCADNFSDGGTEAGSVRLPQAGTYYIYVGGFKASQGRFQVLVGFN